MAKRFGLRELERVSLEVGGVNPASVLAMRTTVAVMGGKWTAADEAEAARAVAEANATHLREESARAEARAAARAEELRKQAEQAERDGEHQAGLLRGQADSRAVRARQLKDYLEALK